MTFTEELKRWRKMTPDEIVKKWIIYFLTEQ
jgi:hypothetical protein